MIFDLWWAAQVENSMMFHEILKREVSGGFRYMAYTASRIPVVPAV